MSHSLRQRLRGSAVLLSLLAAGCAGSKRSHRLATEGLTEAARSYNESVRWGHFEKALEFVTPSERSEFLVLQQEQASRIRIVDVRIGLVDLPRKSKEATVTVTRTFYRVADLQERSETAIQRWSYREDQWFVAWK